MEVISSYFKYLVVLQSVAVDEDNFMVYLPICVCEVDLLVFQ